MSNIVDLTVHELQEKLKNKELSVTEITKAYVDRINEKEKDVQAFVTLLTDEAISQAEKIQEGIEKGEIKKGDSRAIASEIYGLICSTLVYKKRETPNMDVMKLYHEYENTIIKGLKIK